MTSTPRPSATTPAPVWPGPRVLVPIHCDVLLIGEKEQAPSNTWVATQANYAHLVQGKEHVAAPPFLEKEPPELGAHLMWTLPAAMRQGHQNEDTNALEFPFVPNRWLVLKYTYAKGETTPSVSAVVIESDHLTPAPFNPRTDKSTVPNVPNGSVDYVGTSTPLPSWQATVGSGFLQAIGPGEVSWNANYDNVRNVFSFHDPEPAEGEATLTYVVLGWYAWPGDDLLAVSTTTDPKVWKDLLESSFQWSTGKAQATVTDAMQAYGSFAQQWGIGGAVGGDLPPQVKAAATAWQAWRAAHGEASIPTSETLPTQTMCHAMVANVVWKGTQEPYGSGSPWKPGDPMPQLAIGATGDAAVGTYLAHEVGNDPSPSTLAALERAVVAFQRGVLDRLGPDPVGTEASLHRSGFRASTGGSAWTVTLAEGQTSPSGQSEMLELSKEATDALVALNVEQEQLDRLVDDTDSLRGELGALLYKQYTPGAPPVVEQAIAAVRARIDAADIEGKTKAVGVAAQDLQSSLGSRYLVQKVARRPHFAAQDPVVLVAGAGLDPKHAEPGWFGTHDLLEVRVTGQAVSRFEVSFQAKDDPAPVVAWVDTSAVLGKVPLGLPADASGLPKEVVGLAVEALLLDTSAAPLLARLYFDARGISEPSADDLERLAQQIRAQQTALLNDSEDLGVDRAALQLVTGHDGVVPSHVALSYRKGQPWTPIFMDWRATWYPSPAGTDPSAAAWPGRLEQWELGEIDYQWTESSPPNGEAISFQGRTVLNPAISQAIEKKLSEYAKGDYDDPNLPEFVRSELDQISAVAGNSDLLTQSLSGLTDQMTTRLQAIQAAQPEGSADATRVGDGPWLFGPQLTAEAGHFLPIRAGHLTLTDLWVVDSFGQLLRGKDPSLPKSMPVPGLQIAESLATGTGHLSSFIQLAPRVAQPVRGELRLIQADRDDTVSNSSERTSPICGYMMVNFLDQSLMIFDAQGNNQGALIEVQRDHGERGIRWDAVPGSPAPLGAPPALANPHLQAFVTALLATGLRDDSALRSLFLAFEDTLWQAGPVAANQGNLGVLVGRPMALVRGRVQLDLQGAPRFLETMASTGQAYLEPSGSSSAGQAPFVRQQPFETLPFHCRIGDLGFLDNGVVGYFVGDDYSRLHPALGIQGQTGAARDRLRSGRLRHLSELELAAPTLGDYIAEPAPIPVSLSGDPVYVSVIADPRLTIPVVFGSVPPQMVTLPERPVIEALRNMRATFRVGPLLVDPEAVRMPLPSEVRGKWAWKARKNVSTWAEPQEVNDPVTGPRLGSVPPRLREGWLELSAETTETPEKQG